MSALMLVAGALVGVVVPPRAPHGLPPEPPASAITEYGRLPLTFEPNVGQAGPETAYVARGRGYRVSVEPAGARLVLGRPDHGGAEVRLSLVGGDVAAASRASEPLAGRVNHYVGDPSRWQTGIPTFGRVTTTGVYPGVDLVWYGTQGGSLEYDLVVAPGADPAPIEVALDGAEGLRLTGDGALLLDTPAGRLVQHPPVAYQHVAGRRVPVAARYVLDGNRVRFALGDYDRSQALVIDPVLAYSTYLGGTSSTTGNGIAVDAAGNAHVVGITTSTDFPAANPSQATHGGGDFDAFVTKLNASGTALLYSTYLGGSGYDEANDVAVDGSGNAYVVGTTGSGNFPTANALDASFNGNEDAFVVKLNASGVFVYSTYLGGSLAGSNNGDDIGKGIAVDASGNAYVTGDTFSNDFPMVNAVQATRAGLYDAFVAKLNAAGSALVYSTYLGGGADDLGQGIAVDGSGNAVVVGETISSAFPTVNAAQSTGGGVRDAFVTKLNPQGTALVYSTYYGGSQRDQGFDVAVDGSGNAYFTGVTASPNFPTLNPFDATLGSDEDAFVVKLTAAGARAYSTYLGGSLHVDFDYLGQDAGYGIGVDGAGQAHVTGLTQSTNFPVARSVQASMVDVRDAFVTKLNAAGTGLVYSTYLGGGGSDEGLDIAVRGSDAYVTGETESPGGTWEGDFPTTPGAFQTTEPGASASGFVTKVTDQPTTLPPATRIPDFDGDGDTDRSVFRNGAWYAEGQATAFLGVAGDIPVPGNYDGDPATERAVYRDGAWFVEGMPTVFLGTAGDIPVPGDYDGDGDTERAVYRPSVGGWYVEGQNPVFYGLSTDLPVPADYDGDGDFERAVYRPSVGGWYVDGQATVFLGLSTDIPVVGQYDADAAFERAVWRPSVGGWYVEGGPTVFLGLNGDVPVPGDYNGDGDTERGIWRPSVGGWYVEGVGTAFLGVGSDVPLPLPWAVYDRFF